MLRHLGSYILQQDRQFPIGMTRFLPFCRDLGIQSSSWNEGTRPYLDLKKAVIFTKIDYTHPVQENTYERHHFPDPANYS